MARPAVVLAAAAAVSLVSAAPAQAHSGDHTVRSGDTLSKLAASHGVSWRTIYANNRDTIGANPNVLRIGQVLTIGGAGSGPSSPSASGAYVVRAGDTLSRIAARHGTTWQQLHAANREVIGANPNVLRVGQRLSLTSIRTTNGNVVLPGSSTPVTGSAPPSAGYFTTLAPGSALPSDSSCASQVRRSTWEPRPSNADENSVVPPAGIGTAIPKGNWGGDSRAENLKDRITGNFTGTTDEIIQWAACKWGFADNHVRATASTESAWHMDDGRNMGFGDFETDSAICHARYPIASFGASDCPSSFGIVQVKDMANQGPHESTFPYSIDSTAFNLDYTFAMRRACYEGWLWFGSVSRGDEEGCAGVWFAGDYGTPYDDEYLAAWRNHWANQTWLSY